MSKQEAPLEQLSHFIPPLASRRVMEYLHEYKVHLTITRERKSILGDYRHATLYQPHRISVNGNLNRFSFLITLIHEIAHLATFVLHRNKVAAHGQEWKKIYANILQEFIEMKIFPSDICDALNQSMHNLPASSCADDELMRILKRYDVRENGLVMVEEVEEGKLFDIGKGKLFLKGKKLRKRYQCTEVSSGKIYLFSPIYEVKAV
ncbi:MAG TPA: SprT-like domain-containing protein [Flavitalea sp.]|nr:SprT-like domain-containing protein [Flavitalea sp.]